ncbi:MAG: cupredoxin domain-containing protein, partial [Acidimicrobiia bacterium]
MGAGAFALAIVAVAIAFGVLLIVAFDDDEGDAAAAPAGSATVSLSEFALTPDSVTVPVGGKLTVTNTGTAMHNLGIVGSDLVTPDLAAGASAELDVSELEAGLYTMYCEIPGHKEAGMTGDLHIGEGDHGAHGVNAERLLEENDASDAAMKAPVDAYVAQLTEGANTEGVGNTPLEPNVLPDGTKEFELTAEIIDWQVDPETTVAAWAYNGQVPGPWIRVEPGDRV